VEDRRGKTALKGAERVVSTKGKRKEKTLSPAVLGVVLGKLQGSVADVEELRQKREEDIRKCGRVVRSVGKTKTRLVSPDKVDTSSEYDGAEKNVTEDDPYESPDNSLHASANAKCNCQFLKESNLKFIPSKYVFPV